MKTPPELRVKRSGEQGSALLIVFVFAAMVAIMLYRELPVAAFEAERNREQLTIDRGNEYAHAVKLYLRKVGNYPASLNQLEDTNRMRFLRHRFKDPLTENGEWRLLHAGPGGMLIDSKVNPLPTNANGTTPNGSMSNGSTSSLSSSNTSTASSAFGSTSTASNSNAAPDDASQTTVPTVPQRPPAIAANGGAVNGQPPATSDPNANPMTPLLSPGQTANAAQNGQPGLSQNAAGAPGDTSNQQGAPGAAGAAPGNANQNQANNPNQPNGLNGGQAPPGAASSSSGMGVMNSGGIAGVASKAQGHSIKTVNDQSEYSLWEFYYDPRKDATRGVANALAGMQNGAAGATQNQNAGAANANATSGSNQPGVNPTGVNQPGAVLSTAPGNPNPTSTNPPQ